MASTLNMDYLSAEMGYIKHLNVTYSYNVIRNSLVIVFSKIMDINSTIYLSLISGATCASIWLFLSLRHGPDYGIDLYKQDKKSAKSKYIFPGKSNRDFYPGKIVYEHLHFNDDIFQSTKDIAAKKRC